MATNRIEHALTLIARLHGGEAGVAAQARAALEAWRADSPDNEAAFLEADARWRAVGEAAGSLRDPAPARRRSVRAAKAAAVLGVMLAVMLGGRWYWQLPVFDRQYETGVARIARVELPDGSRLDLDARTRLQAVLYRDRREVLLTGGEARFDVATETDRPFTVATGTVTVRVLGTAFVVSTRGDKAVVTVERGRVSVSATDGTGSVELTAGERVAITSAGIEHPGRAPAQTAMWRTGWLAFDDVPLSEALHAINAWRDVPIVLADEQAGRQRLTGSFRVDDPASVPDLLSRVLPVVMRRGAGGRLEIASAPAP